MNLRFLIKKHPRLSSSLGSSGTPGSSGFTLMEVLIAMTILVFISFGIYQATTETYKLRDTLSVEGDFYNSIRLAIGIIQRDIALIYSPLTLGPPAPPSNGGQQQPQPGSSQGNQATQPNPTSPSAPPMADELTRTSNYWSPAISSNGTRPSRFVGTDRKMSFVSLSHIRIYKDSPDSEFAKVTYELKKDDNNKDAPDGLVLVKSETPNAFAPDDFRDPLARSYELLHGITSLSFSYSIRDGNTWKTFKSWDSDQEDTKNILPDIIEIKLEVKGAKNLKFEGNYKFRPEIPFRELNHST